MIFNHCFFYFRSSLKILTMKKLLLFTLIFILKINCYAQTTFEKGYFIDNSNQKTKCLIKRGNSNDDFYFSYKIDKNSPTLQNSLRYIKEFGFHDGIKYSREVILSTKQNSNTAIKKEMFLQVLVEGEASLYYNSKKAKYFFKKKGGNISILEHRKVIKGFKVKEDNSYKQKLFTSLSSCKSIPKDKFKQLKYKKNSLINFFQTYNKCLNPNYKLNLKKEKKIEFNISLKAGINESSIDVNFENKNLRPTFKNNKEFQLGGEIEFFFPFSKKWSFFIEPTFLFFEADDVIVDYDLIKGGKAVFSITHKTLEIPVGTRRYFTLNKKNKLFLSGSINVNLNSGGPTLVSARRLTGENLFSINAGARAFDMSIGAGYNFNNNFFIEFKVSTNKKIGRSITFHRPLSVSLGYTIF